MRWKVDIPSLRPANMNGAMLRFRVSRVTHGQVVQELGQYMARGLPLRLCAAIERVLAAHRPFRWRGLR